jgi:hypothetical protein
MEFKIIIKIDTAYAGQCQINKEIHFFLDKRLFKIHERTLILTKYSQFKALTTAINVIRRNYPNLTFYCETVGTTGGQLPWASTAEQVAKLKEYWEAQLEQIKKQQLDEAFSNFQF